MIDLSLLQLEDLVTTLNGDVYEVSEIEMVGVHYILNLDRHIDNSSEYRQETYRQNGACVHFGALDIVKIER